MSPLYDLAYTKYVKECIERLVSDLCSEARIDFLYFCWSVVRVVLYLLYIVCIFSILWAVTLFLLFRVIFFLSVFAPWVVCVADSSSMLCCLLSCDIVWHILVRLLRFSFAPFCHMWLRVAPIISTGDNLHVNLHPVCPYPSPVPRLCEGYMRSRSSPLVSGWAGTLWGRIHLARLAVCPEGGAICK